MSLSELVGKANGGHFSWTVPIIIVRMDVFIYQFIYFQAVIINMIMIIISIKIH